MKTTQATELALLLASIATALPAEQLAARNITARDTVSLPGLPSDCMKSYKGLAWGWLPDDANSDVTMAKLNADTGKKGCFFGDYSKINDASYDGSDISYKGAKAEGAIIVPSVMPVGVTWDEVDDSLAQKIGGLVQGFSDQGLVTYLRFAHEMNCYAKPGCASPAYPGGTDTDAYKAAWTRVAKVCQGIKNCYMYWSPNLQDLDTLPNWYPGDDVVDVIGVDHYPNSDNYGSGFAGNFGDFYNSLVAPHNKPFLIGETAIGGDNSQKDAWIASIMSADFSSYPLYKGAMWFEYNKEANFYAVYNQDKDQVNTFDSNFA